MPTSIYLIISAVQPASLSILASRNIKLSKTSTVSSPIMNSSSSLDVSITFVFLKLSRSPAFSLSCFTLSNNSLGPSSVSACSEVSSACQRFLSSKKMVEFIILQISCEGNPA